MGQTTVIIFPVNASVVVSPEKRATLIDLLYRNGIIEPATKPGPFDIGPNMEDYLGILGTGLSITDEPSFWGGPDFSVSCPSCRTNVTEPWLESTNDVESAFDAHIQCQECGTKNQLPKFIIENGALSAFALEISSTSGILDDSSLFWKEMENVLDEKLRWTSIHI